jgi:hypothetical protein
MTQVHSLAGANCCASQPIPAETAGTLILHLLHYSDYLDPTDMLDLHERLIVRHFHVERLSDSQDCFDPPRQRTTRNCRKQKFPAKRQAESIHNNSVNQACLI